MAYKIILVAAAALLQNTNVFIIAGSQPNLLLSVLSPLSFFVKDQWAYLSLLFLGGILIKTTPLLEWRVIALLGMLAAFYYLKKYLPWQMFFNVPIFIAAATFLINLPNFALAEIIYNMLIGLIVLFFLYAKKKA